MKPFLSFDGEGRNGKYVLLQNSDGEILRGDPITIHEALQFLFRPDRTNVWYAAGYDWNMLLANEPKLVQIALFTAGKCPICGKQARKKDQKTFCKKHGEITPTENKDIIDGYEVTILPKKILRIRDPTEHESAIHYDTFGFFQCSFLKALKDWHIQIPEVVEKGKTLRDEFPKDFNIELYNLTETKLHVQLMNMLQSKLDQTGLGELSGYHGAGAIAAKMLENFHVREYAPLAPLHDFRGFEYQSYYGGRIELFKRGLFTNVYNYDINSAYPSATRELPALRQVNWLKFKGNEINDYTFGVAKVKWKPNDSNDQLGPFPFRTERIDGRKRRMVIFPMEGQGYYHIVEIKAAIARGLWNIEVQNGVALESGYETPFKEPINEIMRKRLAFKAAKDNAHIPLKLGANSFYGKFAQRNKDKEEFGHFANYWYAGYITAWTRAQLLTYMNPDSVILAATDGLYSTEPLPCPIGPNLGEWEYEYYKEGCFILPGIYRVDKTYKTRGFPKLEDQEMDNLFTRILNGEKPTIRQKLFVGVRRSLQLHKRYPHAGFYELKKQIDWNSVSAKRAFIDNTYSEPVNPFLWRMFEQRVSAGFRPWQDGKADSIDDLTDSLREFGDA